MNVPEEFREQIQQDAENVYKSSTSREKEDGMWLYRLWRSYGEDERKASFALIYAVQKYVISCKEIRSRIQKVLHMIKNMTLEIRFEASDIHRIDKPGEYLERCREDYDKVHDFFWQNNGLFFLLGMTSVVKTNEVDYEIEHKSKE